MAIDKEVVKDWIVDQGMFRESKEEDNSDFHYVIEFPRDNIMDVVKPKGKDFIVVGCATQVSPEHLQLMNAADMKKQRDFIIDLNMGVNKFLVDFELQVNQNILQQFIITDDIYEDGLTKHNLIKTIKRVFKAKLHCIFLIDKKFGGVNPINKPESNENSMFI